MVSQYRRHATAHEGVGPEPFSELCRKVVILAADDALVVSHCRLAIEVLKGLAHEVVVVCRSSGCFGEIEALGARGVDFDYHGPTANLAREAGSAWALAHILEAEAADVVHIVGSRPMLLGGLALKLLAPSHVVLQPVDLGSAEADETLVTRLHRRLALRVISGLLRRPACFLLVEQPEDLALLTARGLNPGGRFGITGGAGVDPQVFAAMDPPANNIPVAAFIGCMGPFDGLDVLMSAYDWLRHRGERLELELHMPMPAAAHDGSRAAALSEWCARREVRRLDPPADRREIWQHADMLVLPDQKREGVPGIVLEAAACARPLVVADGGGSGHFVRDGIEGFVVPPKNAGALADALQKLARQPDLRVQMGEAARLRLLHGFTAAQVRHSLKSAYLSLFGMTRGL